MISMCAYALRVRPHSIFNTEWTNYKAEDKQTNTAKLNWLVYNVGSYGDISWFQKQTNINKKKKKQKKKNQTKKKNKKKKTVLVCFGSVWFWLVTVLLIDWPLNLLLCPFHKKPRIWWKKSFGFCQTDNPRFSCIMYCYRYRQLTRKNLKVVAEFRSIVKDTKSNTKNFTKSISIHSDYQSVHFW